MAQLDRLLSAMITNRADAIHLAENDVARMLVQGEQRPVTRAPLTVAQIVALLREVAPADAVAHLDAGTPTTFRYDNADGSFGVKLRTENGSLRCSIAVDDHGMFQRMTGSLRAITEEAVPSPAPTGSAPSPGVRAGASPSADPVGEARAQIDELLRALVTKGGSDLHLRVGEPPIIRLHGEMVRLEGKPLLENGFLEAMLTSIMPERNKAEFRDRNDTDYAYEIEGIARFRANAMRERKGVGAVFRVIPATVVSVEQLKIPQEVQNLCHLTKGLVLVTGPTGSGKSTTLCSLVDLVNRLRTDHVITIEDPIEFVHPHRNSIITQREVGVDCESWNVALKNTLRQAPDVILIGEVRDRETMEHAVSFAETGHLVMCTLHANSTNQALDRIVNFFPEEKRQQLLMDLSLNLRALVSQRLIPLKDRKGRVPAVEILLNSPLVSDLIFKGEIQEIREVMKRSREQGMQTFDQMLFDLHEKELISYEDALRNADSVNDLRLQIKLNSKLYGGVAAIHKGIEHMGLAG